MCVNVTLGAQQRANQPLVPPRNEMPVVAAPGRLSTEINTLRKFGKEHLDRTLEPRLALPRRLLMLRHFLLEFAPELILGRQRIEFAQLHQLTVGRHRRRSRREDVPAVYDNRDPRGRY